MACPEGRSQRRRADDARLVAQLRRGDDARTDFYQRILEVQAFLSGKQGSSSAVGFVASHVTAVGN